MTVEELCQQHVKQLDTSAWVVSKSPFVSASKSDQTLLVKTFDRNLRPSFKKQSTH